MKLIRLVFLFVLIEIFVGCEHHPDPRIIPADCGEATTIEEMMEWTYFKVGTYWIYEQVNSGSLDTMTIVSHFDGTSPDNFREFSSTMKSSLDDYSYEYWFNDGYSGDCGLFPGCICRVVDCDKYKPGDAIGGNHTFVFPMIVGNRTNQHGEDLDFGFSTNTIHSDSMTVIAGTFNNVYSFHHDYSVQHNYEAADYFLARNIGVIKKRILALDQEWQLKEYSINQ